MPKVAWHRYSAPILVTRQVIVCGLFYWLLYALSASDGNKARPMMAIWESGKNNA
ncbi:MAG TPA: hypothetical protein VKY19_01365 [Ktedonosporobacter sp.]|jgi:hypothetical protein|nr:hypothetical protein [Ktedonosporobacter sp.]